MKLLTAAEILAADDTQFEDVSVPEWGGSIRLRAFSASEREAFLSSVQKKNAKGETEVNTDGIQVKLLSRIAVDDKGARLFTDEQLASLAKKSASVIDRLFVAAKRLSALDEEAVATIKGESKAIQTSTTPTG